MITYKGVSATAEMTYNTDTLFIPDSVMYQDQMYPVEDVNISALMGSMVRTLYLPATFRRNWYDYTGACMYSDSLENIIVDERNNYLSSVDGVLFTINQDTLLVFPVNRRGSYHIPDGTKYIPQTAFINSKIDTLTMSDDIEGVSGSAFIALANVKSLKFSNSIQRFNEGLQVYGMLLEEIIFGSNLSYIGGASFGSGTGALSRIICLAITPPTMSSNVVFYGHEQLTLFVPRKSLVLYQQAPGWRNLSRIEPIEPPVVSGVNNAEIAWVSNANAAQYTLTIYLDANLQQRLVTLVFNDNGYLTSMDFNPNLYTQPVGNSPLVRGDGGESPDDSESTEFKSYFSFSVTGLRANTEYFYVRQTQDALGEVIDEEQGSFNTLPATPTALEQANDEDASRPTKSLHGGQVLIHRGDADYDLTGRKMELRE